MKNNLAKEMTEGHYQDEKPKWQGVKGMVSNFSDSMWTGNLLHMGENRLEH